MDIKSNSKNLPNTVLALFVIINIIGEVGNVVAWWTVPDMQLSLNGGTLNGVTSPPSILHDLVGSQTALIIGSVILLVIAAVYAYSLVGLLKREKQAALIVMANSVVNRILALLLFAISPAFAFWAVWTMILVVVSYLDYRKLSTSP